MGESCPLPKKKHTESKTKENNPQIQLYFTDFNFCSLSQFLVCVCLGLAMPKRRGRGREFFLSACIRPSWDGMAGPKGIELGRRRLRGRSLTSGQHLPTLAPPPMGYFRP